MKEKNVALLLMGCLQLTYEKKSPLKIVHRRSADMQKNGSRLYYYGARYYASWIARFVSVDPLQHKYPHYTPYQYAGNKPISYIDLDGLEEADTQIQYSNVRFGVINSKKGEKAVKELVSRNMQSPLFNSIFNELNNSSSFETNIYIKNEMPSKFMPAWPSYDRGEGEWEISELGEKLFVREEMSGDMVFNTFVFEYFDDETELSKYKDFFSTGSIEEFVHAWQNKYYSEKYGTLSGDRPGLLNIEYEGKAIVGIIKKELGIPLEESASKLLEQYGQDLIDDKASINDYWKKGKEWINQDNVHEMYKGPGYEETSHHPELLMKVIKEQAK